MADKSNTKGGSSGENVEDTCKKLVDKLDEAVVEKDENVEKRDAIESSDDDEILTQMSGGRGRKRKATDDDDAECSNNKSEKPANEPSGVSEDIMNKFMAFASKMQEYHRLYDLRGSSDESDSGDIAKMRVSTANPVNDHRAPIEDDDMIENQSNSEEDESSGDEEDSNEMQIVFVDENKKGAQKDANVEEERKEDENAEEGEDGEQTNGKVEEKGNAEGKGTSLENGKQGEVKVVEEEEEDQKVGNVEVNENETEKGGNAEERGNKEQQYGTFEGKEDAEEKKGGNMKHKDGQNVDEEEKGDQKVENEDEKGKATKQQDEKLEVENELKEVKANEVDEKPDQKKKQNEIGVNPKVLISFGDDKIDAITNGGVSVAGLTEIVGEAGLGKTQLAIQLALQVQLPVSKGGMDKGAAYIYSKGRFPIGRLHELSEKFAINHSLNYNPMDKIHIACPFNWEEFVYLLEKPSAEPGIKGLSKLMSTHDIGLIIVDSIAGYFRTFGVSKPDYVERNKVLARVSKLLKRYEGCAVVVLNEVSAAIQLGINVPTLTTNWQRHVSNRIWVTNSSRTGCRQIEYREKRVPIVITRQGVSSVF